MMEVSYEGKPRPIAPRILAGTGVVMVVLILLVVLLRSPGDTSRLPLLGTVPPFSLTDQSGKRVSQDIFRNRTSIVDFIFTSCTSICPVMSGRMAFLQEKMTAAPSVQFLSFSVDPERDTPPVLSEYGTRYGAISGKWMFFTGAKSDIYRLVRNGFHLGLETEGEDVIIHSSKFVLVDDSVRIRGYYDSDDEGEMDRLQEDARMLDASLER